jgi:Ribbon-helix-helix protein, copG family
MAKAQVYLRREELEALRKAAARARCSVSELIRTAIRKVISKAGATGPIAIWDGEPKRTSVEHDVIHDKL